MNLNHLLLRITLISLPCNLFAQLTVDTSGTVAIPSKLAITSDSDYGLSITRTGAYNSTNNFLFGANASVTNYGSAYNVGLCGTAYASTALGSGRAWGLKGHAGNSTSGFNYGVGGSLRGAQFGAGILGTTGVAESPYIPGRFAGYFLGDVKVTGNLTANTLTSSDKRLKKNITSFSNTNTLEKVMLLNPVMYNLKQHYYSQKNSSDTTTKAELYNEDSQVFKKTHYGLLAQELQEIYPELVYEDATGLLAIDYTGLIPILIQSIKELQEEVSSLKNYQSNASEKNYTPKNNTTKTIEKNDEGCLMQNSPNPFSQSTQIEFLIPNTAQTADIYIYTIQGQLVKKIPIPECQSGSITVSTSELASGVYLYHLIIDGEDIDFKKMIISE